jgi:hypothetical protein
VGPRSNSLLLPALNRSRRMGSSFDRDRHGFEIKVWGNDGHVEGMANAIFWSQSDRMTGHA